MKCEVKNPAYNKIVIDKTKILNMVNTASLLTNKKSTEILFTCLCVEITQQNIIIKSTNGISCCMITEDYNSNNQDYQWCFMIHGVNFLKILKQLDDQFISIEDNTNNAIIIKNQTGTDCFTLDKIAYNHQDVQFPQLDQSICSIGAEDLKNLIDQTGLNVLEERGGSIAVRLEGKQAQLIVYDNTRISWATKNEVINLDQAEPNPLLLQIHIDIPSRQYLYKILLNNKQLDYQISIGYSVCKKFIFWSYHNRTFFCKTINKPLLDYAAFLPSHQHFITINTKEFIKALNKVSVVISEINYAVSLTTKQNGELLICSNNPANGAQSSIIIKYSGQETNNFVKLNIKYLLEALKTIKEDTINLSILSHNKPIYMYTLTTNHIIMSIAHIE